MIRKIIGIMLALIAVIGIISVTGGGEIGRADALVVTSSTYYLCGEYTWVEDGPYGLHNEGGGIGSEIRHGSVLIAKARMESEQTTGEYYESAMDTIFNLSWYVIGVNAYKETNASNFTMKKNGLVVINQAISGPIGLLHTAPLEDGNYEINISFSYKPTITSICVFNFMYRFKVDGTAPSYSLKANGVNIASGSDTNKLVRFEASDINSPHVLYKAPGVAYKVNLGVNYYEIPLNGTEGEWRFYARDALDNASSEVIVYVDRTLPVGKILLESGLELSSIYSKSKVKFTATDNRLVDRYEYKIGNGSWLSYTSGNYILEAGSYTFRAFDKAGNVSSEKNVVIDYTPPSVFYHVDSLEVVSGSETKGSKIKATSLDYLSGVKEMYVKRPGDSSFSIYLSGNELVGEGKYYFYAKDNSGNTSEIQSLCVDNTAPVLNAFYGNEALVWNGYTNRPSIRVSALDNISSEITLNVKGPGASNYTPYLGENLTGYGEYLFIATDKAGNVSAPHKITRDDVKPIVKGFGNGLGEITLEYSNAESIYFEGEDALGGNVTLRVKEPLKTTFSGYNEGTLLSSEGMYEIYGIDLAGNESNRIYITLDRVKPLGDIYSQVGIVSSEYTNKQYVSYSAEDTSGIKETYIKRPGSSEYEKYVQGGEVGVEGVYLFKAIDNAGNVSLERRVVIDRVLPYVTLELQGMLVPYGHISKEDFLCYGDDNYGIKKIFLMVPGAEIYTEYQGEVLCGIEGESFVYAEDLAGNISEVASFVIDKSIPVGKIENLEGELVEGEYTNGSFKYVASDINGIKLMQWKTPSDDNWRQYKGTSISSGDNGIYAFRCFDMGDNLSSEVSVFFDNTLPIGSIEVNGNVSQKRYISAESMLFRGEDIGSGIKEYKVKMPGQTGYINLGENIPIYGEGEYSFIAYDKANNVSEVKTVTLDRTIPRGYIYQNGSSLNSGSYINTSFYFEGVDDHTNVDKAYIKYPNSINWETYTKDTDFSGDEVEGQYFFKCVDMAGNESTEISVNYDVTVPTGNIYVSVNDISSPVYPSDFEAYYGSVYSNRNCVTFYSPDTDIFCIEVMLPGAVEYSSFSIGSILSGEGEYAFRAKDLAGNFSNTQRIFLDRTAPTIEIIGLENVDEIGQVTVIASDASYIEINGVEIISGQVVNTIYQGTYNILARDLAGNQERKYFTSYYEMGIEKYPIEEWFEVELKSKTLSYASYESAINASLNEEAEGVIFASWATGEIWNTGVMMDSVDSINAKPGEYYIYKSSDNPSVASAYFTEARIYEVALSYAEKKVTKVRYFEKEPSEVAEWEDIYISIAKEDLILKGIDVVEGIKCFIDEIEVNGQYNTPGSHSVEFLDEYNNSLVRNIKIITSYPTVYIRLGKEVVNSEGLSGYIETSSDVSPYYFPDGISVAINEETDANGYFFVKDTSGNILDLVNKDEHISILGSGKYFVGAVNRFGLSPEIEVNISLNPANVEYTTDSILKRMSVLINPSSDLVNSITLVQIEKSLDGTNYQVLSSDDYGADISVDRFIYQFRTSGNYKVYVEDRFRSGTKALVFESTYIKPMPEGTLNGVEINGITNGTVSFSWSDEARAYIDIKGSARASYEKGIEIIEEGEYTISLIDFDNNISSYPFTIKTSAPIVSASGVVNGGKTSEVVTLSTLGGNISCLATRNGESFSYVPGESLTAPGIYEMRFVDEAGNITLYSFEITEREKSQAYIWIIAGAIFALGIGLIILKRKFSGFRYKKQKSRKNA